MKNTNLSWGSELDGKFKIIGFVDGLPVIGFRRQKTAFPKEFDFLEHFYPNNPQAREYFAL
jgi:hypothetical protein